ncbi:MAG: DNA-deoxyinosine glycosylase [Brevundimonas sp.]|uniref:DNA-deoxyinosine glycosylase n=1 Tax=Brevundimonas sp. TaxID=1871086 RepID=UPI0025C648E3|nr:DNA-deoxyinosine glycosylase [Brevundimonas sp.]MBX3477628.1 DNA-deoxyinosine glycosylase [Brevundimonas sp.]
MTRKTHFPPIVDDRTRVLILGSLPGEASLKAGRYYAHPRNGFWRLTGAVIGRDLQAMDYEARLAALGAAGIGLWDVVASAERAGSLDAAIRSPQAADLRALVAGLPGLRAAAFNGGAAARLGMRQLAGAAIPLLALPSSSPAHARPFAGKLEGWSVLKPFLD